MLLTGPDNCASSYIRYVKYLSYVKYVSYEQLAVKGGGPYALGSTSSTVPGLRSSIPSSLTGVLGLLFGTTAREALTTAADSC